MTLQDAGDAELVEVREDEALDLAALRGFLDGKLPGAAGEPRLLQFGGGHANLTYLLRYETVEFVVRRPPLGPVAPGAHDMAREHQVLARLPDAFPLAPRSYLLCTDATVLGAPFHVMERKRGVAVRSELPAAAKGDPALCRRMGETLIETLARLHSVDAAGVGLTQLGKPQGYVARQLEGWAKRWTAAKDRALPRVDGVIATLSGRLPSHEETAILHNDFKLDNMLLDSNDLSTPTAVLDWDMCTRGDPRMDLGQLLAYWTEAGDATAWRGRATMPTWEAGFATREEAAALYGARTGLDMSDWSWYYAFGILKLLVIVQQIWIRYLRGQTADPRFAGFGELVESLAARAEEAAGGGR